MQYPFNQAFEIKIYCWNDGERLSNIPEQSATGFIFENKPNLADAIAGTNAISSAAETHTSGDVLYFSFPAIEDPNPNSETKVYDYWLGANFILEDGGETQTIIRAIQLSRVIALDTDFGVDYTALLRYAPQLSSYLSTEQLNSHVAVADVFLKEALRNKGIDFSKLDRLDRFKQAITFKALELAYISQVEAAGDKFNILAETWGKAYIEIMGLLTFEYNNNGASVSELNTTIREVRVVR